MKLAMLLSAITGLLCLHSPAAAAQERTQGARELLRLGALQEEALAADPRLSQLQFLAAQTELRLRNIAADRLPSLTGEGQAQYQSDVVEFPLRLPGGQPVVSPPKDTYDAYLRVQQPLVDPTVRPRLAAERAQLAEAQARVRTALFSVRQEVNEAFFAAVRLEGRLAELDATITDFEARLREADARVREGTALPGEAAAFDATLLQRRQDQAELRANRRAALARLAELTRHPIAEDVVLALPELDAAAADARSRLADLRARPEFAQFARTRERLNEQKALATAREQPRLSAFGRVGSGRPGLNFVSNQFNPYWLAGLQVQWAPWTWGAVNREREALALQERIVAADEEAFRQALSRAVQDDLASMDRLDATLALDDRIIALREAIERETRLRFQEGVVTAAEYVDRSTDVLEARVARARHRVELAQARARFLTTLGLEVR